MSKILKFEAGSKLWKGFRKNHITATEMATLFGLKGATPLKQVLQGKTEEGLSIFMNNNIIAGMMLEPGVPIKLRLRGHKAHCYSDKYTYVLEDKSKLISASLDAFIIKDKKKRMLEIKSTVMRNFMDWVTILPFKYLMQCQVQMYCKGHKEMYLALVGGQHPEFPIRLFKLKRLPGLKSKLIKAVNKLNEEKELFTPDEEYKEYFTSELPKTIIEIVEVL
jgi:hypothetical protein